MTGIGKVQATMNLTSLLAKEKIDLVIMTGSAGSLQKEVQRMDLVLPSEFATTMPTTLQRATMSKDRSRRNRPALSWTARKETSSRTFLGKKGVAYKEGLVVTGDSFISSQAQKDEILGNFPTALCVEMEGAAFAQVAYHFNVPLIALRAISDNGDEDADNDFAAFVRKVGAQAAELIVEYLRENDF